MSGDRGGQRIELELDELAFGGDAVGRHRGKVVFVPLGAPGDRAVVRLTERRRSLDRAELVELLSPGPWRREPPCELFGRCGGCHWQHVRYERQVDDKARVLERAMRHLGVERLERFLAAPEEWRYRRRFRMGWHVAARGPVTLGYRGRRSRTLVDASRCPLLVAELGPALEVVREAVARAGATRGSVAGVVGDDGSIHLSLRGCADARPARWIVDAGHRVAGVVLLDRRGSAGQIVGEEAVCVDGVPTSAAAFAQANAAQAVRMRAIAVQWAAAGAERVLELHAGSGNFTGALRREARDLVAVEASRVAASLLRRSCGGPSSGAVRVVEGEARSVVEGLARRGERFDVALLNPPREGDRELCRALSALRPRRVVYVSCDPMTLGRDAGTLGESGYRVARARGIDLMPQTYHLETVALLERRAGGVGCGKGAGPRA